MLQVRLHLEKDPAHGSGGSGGQLPSSGSRTNKPPLTKYTQRTPDPQPVEVLQLYFLFLSTTQYLSLSSPLKSVGDKSIKDCNINYIMILLLSIDENVFVFLCLFVFSSTPTTSSLAPTLHNFIIALHYFSPPQPFSRPSQPPPLPHSQYPQQCFITFRAFPKIPVCTYFLNVMDCKTTQIRTNSLILYFTSTHESNKRTQTKIVFHDTNLYDLLSFFILFKD